MLNQQGYLKITDFGIAHVQDDSLTKTGSILGSPLFMSPEQVFGLKSISSQADIFSLGAVFYTCLVGVHPFNGKNLPELYRKISLEPHIPAGHWLPSLDPALNRLVDLLLHKDPKQRGGGPKWLHRQLKAYLLAKEISEPTECVSEYLKDLSSKGLHTTWGLEIKSQRTQHATLKSSPQMEGTLHFSREDNQKWSSGIFVSLLVAFFLMAVGIGFGIKEFHLFNQASSSTQPSKGVALQLSQVESVARPSELAARQSRSALKPVLSELSISSISNPSSKNPSPALEDSSLALTPKEAQVSQLNLSELKFAVLSLYSSPPFREVYLDGKFAGVTPFVTGSLSIGEHHFVSKSEGWRSIDTVLILGPGTQSLKLKFEDGKLPVLAGNSEE